MKIWCRYRPGMYVIQGEEYLPADRFGHRQKTKGLKVEFTTLGGPGAGSLLDTVAEAERQGWDTETREAVEHYLQGHQDWGFALYRAGEEVTTGRQAGASCQVMTIVHGGVRTCGRPVESEGDLCDIHAAQEATLDAQGPDLPPMPDADEVQGVLGGVI